MSRVTIWLDEEMIEEACAEGQRRQDQADKQGWKQAYDNKRSPLVNHQIGCIGEKACGEYLGLEVNWDTGINDHDLPHKIEIRSRVPDNRYPNPDLVVGIPKDLEKPDSPYILCYTREDLKPTIIVGWMRMKYILEFFPKRTSHPLEGYNVVPPHRLHPPQQLVERFATW